MLSKLGHKSVDTSRISFISSLALKVRKISRCGIDVLAEEFWSSFASEKTIANSIIAMRTARFLVRIFIATICGFTMLVRV
jgi:hypothetical protein